MSKEQQFIDAAQAGNIEQLDALWTSSRIAEQQEILQANNYSAFREAATNGHIQILDMLWARANPEQRQAMLQPDGFDDPFALFSNLKNYSAFNLAAGYGHIQALKKLWGWATPTQQQKMLQIGDYRPFGFAAGNGHVNVLEKLRGWAANPEQQQAMLQADNHYDAFRWAAANGQAQVLEKIWGWADIQARSNLISRYDDILLPVLTSVAKNTNYTKLLVDIFAHMSPKLCNQAKRHLNKHPDIKFTENFDQQVDKRRDAYGHVRYILREVGILIGHLNFLRHYSKLQLY